MRFLADENFPLASVWRLREVGHDVMAAAEAMSGSRDEQILSRAAEESRILLTFDRDYGELIYRKGLPAPAGVVYLRLAPAGNIEGLRLEGRYTVVDPPRVRQRPLP